MKKSLNLAVIALMASAAWTLIHLGAPLGWVAVGMGLGAGICFLSLWQMTRDGWAFLRAEEYEGLRRPTPDTPERVETIRRADRAYRAGLSAKGSQSSCWSCGAGPGLSHRVGCKATWE